MWGQLSHKDNLILQVSITTIMVISSIGLCICKLNCYAVSYRCEVYLNKTNSGFSFCYKALRVKLRTICMLGKHSSFVLILHPNNILKCSFYVIQMLIKYTFKVKACWKENAFPIVELGQWPGKRQAGYEGSKFS